LIIFRKNIFVVIILLFVLVTKSNSLLSQDMSMHPTQVIYNEKIESKDSLLANKISFKKDKSVESADAEWNNKLEKYLPFISLDFANHLSEAVKFKTITTEDTAQKANQEFIGLNTYLRSIFPLVYSKLEVEQVNRYSLLFRWKGKHANLKPILIIGHLDVVPIENGTEKNWEYDAFSGAITDSFIWGRGTIDNKICITGVLESVETLLRGGYQPDRDIYIAYGNDEEIDGKGAASMAELLTSRNIHFESVLDEGGGIVENLVSEIQGPVAFICVGEKGYLTLELGVKDEGGHSSYPKHETVLGILSGAVHRLETDQFPTRLTPPVRQMLRELGNKIGGIEGFAAKHTTVFSALLKKKLASEPYTNSLVQTTTAVTVFEGGVAENVMPTHARAVINFRILPGETVKSVLRRVKKVIDDKRVSVLEFPYSNDPPKLSSIHSSSYRELKKTIKQIYGDTLTIAPALSISASDSRHYDQITDNIYRFTPLWAKPGDVERLHGTNERIGINDYKKAIQFYCQYILNSGKKDGLILLPRKQ
jgi:carboxypeptidase PM20D1